MKNISRIILAIEVLEDWALKLTEVGNYTKAFLCKAKATELQQAYLLS